MFIECDRIKLPDFEDDKLDAVAEQRMKRVRCVFNMLDVSSFCIYKHNKNTFVEVFFYYTEPWIVDYDFKQFKSDYEKAHEEGEKDGFPYFIPAN